MTDVGNNMAKWGGGETSCFPILPKLMYSKSIKKRTNCSVSQTTLLPQSRPLLTHRSHPLLPRYRHRSIHEPLSFPGEDIIHPRLSQPMIAEPDSKAKLSWENKSPLISRQKNRERRKKNYTFFNIKNTRKSATRKKKIHALNCTEFSSHLHTPFPICMTRHFFRTVGSGEGYSTKCLFAVV